MKRPQTDQLRKQLTQVTFQYEEPAITLIAMTIAETLINIGETLEDIAAGLDRERLRSTP